MKLIPRDYQVESVKALFEYFRTHPEGNPVIGLPTGTGKSVVIAHFLEEVYRQYPKQKILIGTHVKELIKQNHDELLGMWPHAPAGIYSAGLNRKDIYQRIIFCGIASINKNIEQFGHVDLFMVDECHLISQEDESMYLKAISVLKAKNPYLKVIGLTATPWRAGQGRITDCGIFTDMAIDLTDMKSFNRFIAEGHLVPLVPKRTDTQLDVSAVKVRGGEYLESDLQATVNKDHITRAALNEVLQHGETRRHWLIFGSGIEHVKRITELLIEKGITACNVHSKMTSKQRDQNIADWKAGKYQAMVNNGILTTGVNFRALDMIVMLRPTKSTVLWVQMLGRGTRPSPETFKENCILEGQKVLTNKGWIKIENITADHKIWDGMEYVNHGGVYAKGSRKIITYRGLSATPDHKVWCDGKWQPFEKIVASSTHIAKGSIFGFAVQELDSCFPLYSFLRRNTQKLHRSVQDLSKIKMGKFEQLKNLNSRLFRLFSPTTSSFVDSKPLHIRKTKMHKFCRTALGAIWRSWNTFQFYGPNSNGFIFNGIGSQRYNTSFTNRSYEQQWSLRNWKFTFNTTKNKYEQSTSFAWAQVKTFVQTKLSKNKICGLDIGKFISQGFYRFTNCGSLLQPKIKQTKGRVWDIYNCGPRNRFTCEGYIVSNCLVLDFAGNTGRLGPINDPVIPKRKGEPTGEVPIKICEGCGTYNHISARYCGGQAFSTASGCGAEFVFKTLLHEIASGQELIKQDELPIIEVIDIDHVTFALHKKMGKPDSVKVTYYAKFAKYSEYILFEHEGFGRRKARQWWAERSTIAFPETTEQALRVIDHLAAPSQLRVWVNKKYPEIMSAIFIKDLAIS